MIKQYNWKHLAIASLLTIALCVGFLLYNQWDLTRFRESLIEDTTQTSAKQQPEKVISGETFQQPTPLTQSETEDDIEKSILPETEDDLEPSILPESDSENNEIEVANNQEKDVEEATFDEFLGFLDELDDEELATLIESLELEDDEKEAFAELTEQESEITEDVLPSSMIIDMLESEVASLTGLIELMEESTTVMPERIQERFEPVLLTLQTIQVNGGQLMVHRPPEDPRSWMLLFINSNSSPRRVRIPPDARNYVRYGIVFPDDPSRRPIILDRGNSDIID